MSESLRGTGRTSRMLVEAIAAARAAPDGERVLVVVGDNEQRPMLRHAAALAGTTLPNIVVVSLDDVESGRMRGVRWAATFEDHTVAEERERRAQAAQVRYPERYNLRAAFLAAKAGKPAATVAHPGADSASLPSPAPMAMVMFREGDVVCERHVPGIERTVVAVGTWPSGAGQDVQISIGTTSVWDASAQLTLLRRPVRVGDALTHGTGHRQVVETEEHARHSDWIIAGWTHADGTVIEMPPPAWAEYRRSAMYPRESVVPVEPKGALPAFERMRRALFETDDEVIAHVRRVSEFRVKGCTTDEMRAAILRRDDAMQRCFDRGSSGESPEWRWFVRASDRAEAMTARIRGGT